MSESMFQFLYGSLDLVHACLNYWTNWLKLQSLRMQLLYTQTCVWPGLIPIQTSTPLPCCVDVWKLDRSIYHFHCDWMETAHTVAWNATPFGFAYLQRQLEINMDPWRFHAHIVKPLQCYGKVSFLLHSSSCCANIKETTTMPTWFA